MLRFLRGRTADGDVAPAAKLVALLVVVGMLAVAAPVLFRGLAWVASLL
ncbi:hypothetical protein [Aquipuribacter sp. SD81]